MHQQDLGETAPTESERMRSTPSQTGASWTKSCSAGGYASTGKNVPENRNIGRTTSWTRSKSCQVFMNEVAAIPTAPNANPMSNADGIARITHGEDARPRTSITTRKPTE